MQRMTLSWGKTLGVYDFCWTRRIRPLAQNSLGRCGPLQVKLLSDSNITLQDMRVAYIIIVTITITIAFTITIAITMTITTCHY